MPALVSVVRRCNRSLSWGVAPGEGDAQGLAAVLLDELRVSAGGRFPTKGLGEVLHRAGGPAQAMLADALQVCVFDGYMESCLEHQAGYEKSRVRSVCRSLDVALRIVSQNGDSPLQTVIASSMLRSAVDIIGKNVLEAKGLDSIVADELSRLLSSGRGAQVLKLAFLRRFRSLDFCMADLRSFCQSGVMPFLTGLPWTEHRGTKLAFNPMKGLAFYDRAEAILTKAIQQPGSRDEARRLIADSSQGAEMRQAVSAALVILLYLPRGWRRLEECEENAAEWLRSRRGSVFKGWPMEEVDYAVKCVTNGFEDRFFILREGSSWEAVQKAALACHLTIVCMAQTSPLQMAALVRSGALRAAYLPAMESDETTAIFNALAAREAMVMKYQCSCGSTYSVGNCGALNEGGRCPDCKKKIGGGSNNARLGQHRTAAPNDAPGYLVEQADIRDRAVYRQVRDLTPLTYRVLRLFEHLLFLSGSESGPHALRRLHDVLHLPSANARSFLSAHVANDWDVIKKLLRLPDDDCFAFLHCLAAGLQASLTRGPGDLGPKELTSPGSRRHWEALFQRLVVDGPVGDVRSSIEAFRTAVGSFEDRTTLEAKIDERDPADTSDPLVALFRSRCPFEVGAVRTAFAALGSNGAAHPFLGLAFESLGPGGRDGVARVSHLPALLSWHVTVEKHLKYRVGRRQASGTTVGGFLAAQGGSASLRAQFDRFREAWNAVKGSVIRFQCTEFPGGVPEMSLDAPLSLCCCERMEPGIYLCAILHHLVDLQNDFLDACANLLSLPEAAHISSRFAAANGTWRFPKKRVQLLRASDVISVDHTALHDVMFGSGLATWDLRYGHGRELLCDFRGIEVALADHLLGGKVIIDGDSIEEMSYRMEAFQGCSTTLHDVSQRFPQQPIGPDGAQALARDLRACQDLWDVKAALEVLLCFLKQDGSNQNRTIGEFVAVWFSDATVDGGFVQRTLLGRGFCSLPVSQVVALYECAEAAVMDSAAWSAHPSYRAEPPPGVFDAVLDALCFGDGRTGPSGVAGRIRAHAMMRVVERLAFRFLSSDREPPWRPTHPAAFYLKDPRFITWPPDSFVGLGDGEDAEDVVTECVPDGLLLEHIGGLCKLLRPMVWVSFD